MSAYVYGYGRTKHIRDTSERAQRFGVTRGEWGLCGAPGGYPTEEPERPTCKRCLKMSGSENHDR